MIGLKRGTVRLCDHEKEWEIEAQHTISRLQRILGNVIKDIQHVGSTAIPAIKAKPIIDIAVAVDDFEDILRFEKELQDAIVPTRRLLSEGSCCSPAAAIMTVRETCRRISFMSF